MKGAEAVIEFRDGKVVKKRLNKDYRHPDLDDRIRKDRTEKELRTMIEARKAGVTVPDVEKVSEDSLEIEEIDGKQLKDVLGESVELIEKVGVFVGKMHSSDIIHGDLTTRNVMVSGEKVYLIDFGLSERSERVEDKAVDLHLLKQVLESSHPDVWEKAWRKFVEGYSGYGESEEVMERLEEVEKRGRYK